MAENKIPNYALPSKVVSNGNLESGHIYSLVMSESTISNAYFEVLYCPSDNNGNQSFGISLSNGANVFACTGKLSFSNGTVSVSNTYRMETGQGGTASWSVRIALIRQIV